MNTKSFYKAKALSAYLLIANCIFFISCTQLNVFEKDTAIPNSKWQSNFTVKGSFAIADTGTAYNIYLVLRHTDAYKYDNIWLNVGLRSPGDTLKYQKVNLELGNDAQGWEGSGMNDIWEVRKLLNERPLPFKRAGNYEFSISQIMRDDPLPNIMSAGLRIERIKN